jgi:transcriptional regulator with XRE-family HTH domain
MMQRVLALRGERTQEDFAEALGVSQGLVSLWEKGERTPDADAYFRMARLARYPESLWFSSRAGMGPDELLALCSPLLKERAAPAIKGEIFRVPIMRSTRKGIEKTESLLALPTTLVENPASTIALTIGKNLGGTSVKEGDTVVIDTSVDPGNIGALVDRPVLMEFAPESEGTRPEWGRRWPEGFHVGTLRVEKQDALGLVWAAGIEGIGTVGLWQWKASAENPEVLGRPKDISRAANEAASQWPTKLRVNRACKIIGPAVAWFGGAVEKK